jgi:hypothetical protein
LHPIKFATPFLPQTAETMATAADRVTAVVAPGEIGEWLYTQGWTDGLPVVPPTEERVAAMLDAVAVDPLASLGEVPPSGARATYEALAANAVMAGCEPMVFPIVVAAVSAVLDSRFNLFGIQATTHPVAPLLIVNGPIAEPAGVNSRAGALGPGARANATIGRALRLILMNVGGARPGEGDRSTHGGPAKFSYCIAENVEESPWPEFHTTLGLRADASAVTVFGGEAPHNVNDHESRSPERLLGIVADVMRSLGHNNWYLAQDGLNDIVVVFGPEHARLLGEAGWSRDDVQRFLFEHATRSVADLRRGGMWEMRDWPDWMNALADSPSEEIPVVRRSADILVVVAGGPGKHSLVIPGFGASRAVTRSTQL